MHVSATDRLCLDTSIATQYYVKLLYQIFLRYKATIIFYYINLIYILIKITLITREVYKDLCSFFL